MPCKNHVFQPCQHGGYRRIPYLPTLLHLILSTLYKDHILVKARSRYDMMGLSGPSGSRKSNNIIESVSPYKWLLDRRATAPYLLPLYLLAFSLSPRENAENGSNGFSSDQVPTLHARR